MTKQTEQTEVVKIRLGKPMEVGMSKEQKTPEGLFLTGKRINGENAVMGDTGNLTAEDFLPNEAEKKFEEKFLHRELHRICNELIQVAEIAKDLKFLKLSEMEFLEIRNSLGKLKLSAWKGYLKKRGITDEQG